MSHLNKHTNAQGDGSLSSHPASISQARTCLTATTLSQSGENLCMVNSELFAKIDKQRREIKARSALALAKHLPEPIKPEPIARKFNRYFQKLAPEIRDMIWALEACRPRLIAVCGVSRNLAFPSSNTLPAILHVCSESRRVGLAFYKQLWVKNAKINAEIPQLYINPACDTIVFDQLEAIRFFLKNARPDSGDLHQIAISAKDFTFFMKFFLRQFSQIHELVLIRDMDGEYGDLKFVELSSYPWKANAPGNAKHGHLKKKFLSILLTESKLRRIISVSAVGDKKKPLSFKGKKKLQQKLKVIEEKKKRQVDEDLIFAARMQYELDNPTRSH